MRAFPNPALCLVTDQAYGDVELLTAKVSAAIEGGVNLVQLRAKELPGGKLLELAESLRQATHDRALFFVNDRVDVALAAGADGVQMGEDALPVAAVRRIAGDSLIIGRSVHSLESGIEAEAQGADFLVVGTMFRTASHPATLPAGLTLLDNLGRSVRIPFLAIGGVARDNVELVMEHGASGAAVISSILAHGNTRSAATGIKYRMYPAADGTWTRSLE